MKTSVSGQKHKNIVEQRVSTDIYSLLSNDEMENRQKKFTGLHLTCEPSTVFLPVFYISIGFYSIYRNLLYRLLDS